MRFADVNVLVYAHRPEAPRHDEWLEWLEAARVDDEPLAVTDYVLAGFVRISTHPRIFKDPTPPAVALDFVAAVRSAPSVVPVSPGERTWPIFEELIRSVDARGNLVPDALIAAMAIEQGATLVTADRGFARYPRLRWVTPVS
ncbi:MAG: type II toxin-antitoxin system VapC family toxin [Acidimicrobiia bacterium]|jgi:toxin-antitoxin system PIN domain toxin|nr:MAG: type II toxin-antitoxin system VapC family toxin [Acidimicrobiia bacterium]